MVVVVVGAGVLLVAAVVVVVVVVVAGLVLVMVLVMVFGEALRVPMHWCSQPCSVGVHVESPGGLRHHLRRHHQCSHLGPPAFSPGGTIVHILSSGLVLQNPTRRQVCRRQALGRRPRQCLWRVFCMLICFACSGLSALS